MKNFLLLFTLIFTIQLPAQCWQSVYTGAGYSIAKKTDGTLWSCGSNNWGQLGLGLTSGSSVFSFTQIANGHEFNKISAGYNHILAIKTNGTLWAWGSNQMGQLGDNSTDSKNAPVQIGTSSNWQSVAAGYNFSVGIKTDGTIWTWGMSYNGSLGLGSLNEDKHIPTQVGAATNWQTAWAGAYFVIAKKSNGTLWGWGANGAGQLGNGTTTNSNVPIQLSTQNWTSISLGNSSAMGLKSNGTLWTWGNNMYGQLGDGTTVSKSIPTQIGTATNWQTISAGSDYSSARKTNGALWTWGNNDNGQLGLGFVSAVNTPTQVGTSTDWQSMSASSYRHIIAIKNNGDIWSWGSNSGNLGNGSFGTEWSPVPVSCAGLGVNDNNANVFTIYPNPANEVLNFVSADASQIDKITVVDITGQCVLQTRGDLTVLNVGQLHQGVYFLRLESNGHLYKHKFIKN